MQIYGRKNKFNKNIVFFWFVLTLKLMPSLLLTFRLRLMNMYMRFKFIQFFWMVKMLYDVMQ